MRTLVWNLWAGVALLILMMNSAAPAKHQQDPTVVSDDGPVYMVLNVDSDDFDVPTGITRVNGRIRNDADEVGSILHIIPVGVYTGGVDDVGQARYVGEDFSTVDLTQVPVEDPETLNFNQVTVLGSFRTNDGVPHLVSPFPGDVPLNVQQAFFNASEHIPNLLAETPNPTTCQFLIFLWDHQGNAGATIDELGAFLFQTSARLQCTTCRAEFEVDVHEPGRGKLFDFALVLDFDNGDFDAKAILPVPVQVKGVSETNPFNLGSNGVFPVSILSTAAFDAPAEVDLDALAILGVGIVKHTLVDANDDGLMDVKVHWDTQELVAAGVDETTTKLFVTGKTLLGMSLAGMDGIRIVPPVD